MFKCETSLAYIAVCILFLFVRDKVEGNRFGPIIIRPLGSSSSIGNFPAATPSQSNNYCNCDQSLNQVCCGGETFINACQARCAGYTNCGACPNYGFCEEIYDPVRCQGREYQNLCFAEQAGYRSEDCCKQNPSYKCFGSVVCCNGQEFYAQCAAACAGYIKNQCIQGRCY